MLSYLVNHFTFTYDDTDDKVNKVRSGLVIITDYGTGNQYVKEGLFGSITPRLDIDGKQVNIKKIKQKTKETP